MWALTGTWSALPECRQPRMPARPPVALTLHVWNWAQTLTLQSGCLLFTCLPALARTSRTLNRSSESLIGGRKRCLSPLRVRFAVVFCRCPLQGEVVLFHSSFVECFYHEEMVDFVQCFFFPERHLLLKCPRQGTLGNLAPAVSRGCGHGVVFVFLAHATSVRAAHPRGRSLTASSLG